jgi:hypothetical protein
MLALWGDVENTLAGKRAPEPLFFRANSGECIEYTLANLVPNVYELDDFQVRTPTDILGQHIHLVKFDVTSSDGATNGFNYEDGTFSPDEVTERIRAINAGGGLAAGAGAGSPTRRLTAKALPFFGAGPGGRWLGAQATIQRWYADPLFDGPRHDPPAPLAVDRTLRTVFTHDHFGPSTHQQAGLYAGLVIEPKGSLWYGNESATGAPFGGVDPKTGQPIPGRTVTGANGQTLRDGGPTTWQAVIETPVSKASFREFVFAVQDSTLTYSPFAASVVNPFAGKGWCAVDSTRSCTPATATKPATGCSTGVCYAYGFCSNNTRLSCRLATWQTAEDVSACNYGDHARGRLQQLLDELPQRAALPAHHRLRDPEALDLGHPGRHGLRLHLAGAALAHRHRPLSAADQGRPAGRSLHSAPALLCRRRRAGAHAGHRPDQPAQPRHPRRALAVAARLGRLGLARQPGDGHLGALRADLPAAGLGLGAGERHGQAGRLPADGGCRGDRAGGRQLVAPARLRRPP